MDASAFEAELLREGYHPVRSERAAGEVVGDHAHGFDAKLLILEGEITIACGGAPQTFRAGDVCMVPAGERHEEKVGPDGVRLLAGRRSAQAAA